MHLYRIAAIGSLALTAMASTARADELTDLKAEIAALDARLAAMEAAPEVPQGFHLLSISEGELQETPGAPLTASARAAYRGRASVIGVLPTADSPAGTTISWSGYARAGVVYEGQSGDTHDKAYVLLDGQWVRDASKDIKTSDSGHETSVGGRAQLQVDAKTGTSVGEVGVELQMRADFSGNTPPDLYAKVAWGYWAMTPDLTLGGGYNQSIGDIVYGYDGSCTCYFTDNADVDFDPGDTTQLRASYVAGPVTFAAAVESASIGNSDAGSASVNSAISAGLLGVAGEVSYTGDVFSGEIAGIWRDSNKSETGSSQIWQLGLGGSITMGDVGSLTFAAAIGEGPYEVQSTGTIINGLPYNNTWWGVSAFTSIKLGDKAHMELAGGYKNRDGDQATYKDYTVSGVNYHTYAVLGGLYYTPVDQLTIGVEGEWYSTSTEGDAVSKDNVRYSVNASSDTLWADAVAVWSF